MTEVASHQRPHRKRVGAAPTCWLLLFVLGLPPGLLYLGIATSTALGMTLVCVGLLSVHRPRQPSGQLALVSPTSPILVGMGLALVITLHLFASRAHGPVDLQRGLLSLIPLTLMVMGGAELANRLASTPGVSLHAGLLAAFVALCGLALVGATGWGPPTLAPEPWRSPVFPFFEPSAFALAFTPTLLYAVVTTRGARRASVLAAALAFPAFITNLTLLCGLLLVTVVTLRIRWLIVLGASVVALALQLDLTYITDRIDFSGESNNLSNLVYIQGWQMIGEAWSRSSGLGTGMLQLGVFGTEVPASDVLRALRNGEDMNLLDGSFAFAKLSSEFGIFGVAIAGMLVALAARSALVLRRDAARKPSAGLPPSLLLAHCSVASFPIELFVRSGGYFTGAGLLLSGALWLLHASSARTATRAFAVAADH